MVHNRIVKRKVNLNQLLTMQDCVNFVFGRVTLARFFICTLAGSQSSASSHNVLSLSCLEVTVDKF